ncbi:hypothetical protein [Curtobacterium sp. USHLN213]|uniref:hypothetical protein n=1 Tax=Curtobacterium sp. USHLN213 TaxID=3081255 RepID=UPI0030179EEE
MGMFDSMIDADGREWQTKAFGRALERWRVGDQVPADDSDFQARVLGDEAFGYKYALATVRDGVLTEVPAERDPLLLLVDYQGGYLESPAPMNAPTPEQMRALADEHDEEAGEYVLDKAEKEGQPEYGDLYEYEDRIVWHRNTATALRAAANEVDRLRDRNSMDWYQAGRDADAENERLRALIENAPHQLDCNTEPGGIGDPNICTCWKADAL